MIIDLIEKSNDKWTNWRPTRCTWVLQIFGLNMPVIFIIPHLLGPLYPCPIHVQPAHALSINMYIISIIQKILKSFILVRKRAVFIWMIQSILWWCLEIFIFNS